jgi:transcriptional regulator
MALKARTDRLDVLQGTLDMLILRTLQWGPQHGLRIAQGIRQRSEELLKVEAGSLYPALHRLEQHGWLTSEWKASDKGQRAKFYRLTRAGRKQLVDEQSKWDRVVRAIGLVMRPGRDEGT